MRVIPKLRPSRLLLCILGVAFATITLTAGALQRASLWREHEIVVDGQDDDWRGAVMSVKGQRFSLGIVNDGEFLYMCLPTKDVALRNVITHRGLMVWLDKESGKKNQFGVHFPIPVPGSDNRSPSPQEGDKPQGERRDHDPLAVQNEVGILGPGLLKAQLVLLQYAGGIEARVGVHGDLVVCELKVPLTRNAEHPYAPDVRPGDVLRVQLETPPTAGGRAPLGHGPGGVPIYGGGSSAGGGIGVHVGVGGPPIGSPDMLEPLEVPLKVKLASGPPK